MVNIDMITSNVEFTTADVARHYDVYIDLWGEHVHHGYWLEGDEPPEKATEQLIDRVVESLHLQSGQKVCDIGCGYGGTARYLTRKFDVSVTGLTLSEKQAAYGNELGQKMDQPPTLLVKSWLENEFPDESFDAVYSIECLAHIVDKPKYFAEMARVLKPGSKAAITAWMVGDSVSDSDRKGLIEPICREGRLPSMGSRADYDGLIESAGLQVTHFEDLTRNVEKTWVICGQRLRNAFFTKPAVWKYLLGKERSEAIFIPSLRRIRKAYKCGAMRYGMYEISKPS